MSEDKDKKGDDKELAALLDTALADFGRTKNTDDELDLAMEDMDRQAMEKASLNFDNLIKDINDKCSKASVSNKNVEFKSESERKAAETFQNMIKALIEAGEKNFNEKSASGVSGSSAADVGLHEYLERMKELSNKNPSEMLDESNEESVMQFIQSFFAKDFMYPSIKQLYEKFPSYMSDHPELDSETRVRYEKQIEVLKRMCAEYEKEDEFDLAENKLKFQRISDMMLELHSYGYPPEELVGGAPEGWSLDPMSGLPQVDDVSKAAESCCVM
ncbi:hypothetical protein AB6A40_005787 [Gnathostoma spinigerum]|uniref:Peroxin-19 n=1 Tax=Gnathostoma spinigerum TaxID=75299 RepID=A0ABD6EQ00_9BILA